MGTIREQVEEAEKGQSRLSGPPDRGLKKVAALELAATLGLHVAWCEAAKLPIHIQAQDYTMLWATADWFEAYFLLMGISIGRGMAWKGVENIEVSGK